MPEIFDGTSKPKKRPKSETASHHKVFPRLEAQANPNPLASFAICPPNTHFETQESEEKIILLLRQHPIVNIPWILLAIILIAAPLALDYVPFLGFLPGNFQMVALIMWYFLVLTFIVGEFLSWYFNVYIVTDERVVDIDFFGLNYRDVKVTKIDKIQDVNFNQGGLWGSFFNYGDVFIQTSGEGAHARYDFLRVPHPGKVVEILGQLIDEEAAEELAGRVK